MDRTLLSPRQAATRIGCGRSSIMRALASGDLRAIRDNKNTWQIDIEDLLHWSGQRTGPSPDIDRTVTVDQPGPDRTTDAQLVDIQVRLAVAEARLSDVTAERDRLAHLLEKALEPRPRRPGFGFFGRLFR